MKHPSFKAKLGTQNNFLNWWMALIDGRTNYCDFVKGVGKFFLLKMTTNKFLFESPLMTCGRQVSILVGGSQPVEVSQHEGEHKGH